jgi:hypothetical protein
VLFALSVVFSVGCASMFMKGGSLVDAGFQPPQVLVSYRCECTAPPNTEYLLIKTDKGEAIYERNMADGSGALFETKWTDEKGDHFAGWVAMVSTAYEVVVPKDRKQPAKRYVYTKGLWAPVEINGIERPVPAMPMEPVSTLVPK